MKLSDLQIQKAEKTLRTWAKGIINKEYTRDSQFHGQNGTKTIMIGYKNIRQFLMIVADLIYYKKKFTEMQKTLEWYADEKNHEVDVTSQWQPVLPIDKDRGSRARACLKGESQ